MLVMTASLLRLGGEGRAEKVVLSGWRENYLRRRKRFAESGGGPRNRRGGLDGLEGAAAPTVAREPESARRAGGHSPR